MSPNTKKYLIYSLGFLLAAIYVFLESQNRGDLTIYLNASQDLFKGDDIFVNTYFFVCNLRPATRTEFNMAIASQRLTPFFLCETIHQEGRQSADQTDHQQNNLPCG